MLNTHFWNKASPKALFVIVLLLLQLSMNLVASPANVNEAKGGNIRVQDASGEIIILAKPAQKVIALAPHLTEQVFTAGGGDKLIATVNYSNYPQEAEQILRLGNYKKISYEMLVSLKPDLILAFGGNGEEMINRLRSLGFNVFVDEPRTLEDVAELLEKLGLMLGTSQQAQQAATEYRQRLQRLTSLYHHKAKVRVFYEVWNKPLLTINDEHLISKVMHLCGGTNIFADAIPMAPKISVESVIRRNPQAIIASGHGDARPDWLDSWLQWPSIDAVQNEHLFFIHPDILQRHSVRILEGAELMCEYLEQTREKAGQVE